MKKIILVSMTLISQINLCPGEGPMYIGMYRDQGSRVAGTEEPGRQLEEQQETKAWHERMRDHWSNFKNRVSDFFAKRSDQSNSGGDTASVPEFGDDDSSRREVQNQHEEYMFSRQRSADEDEYPYAPLVEYPIEPDILKSTPDQILEMNFSNFDFRNFSAPIIEKLLNVPEISEKLSREQIQAIDPEVLSAVLKNKLQQPLPSEFVQKLSDEQVVGLIGDHVEWRRDNWWKNWGTKFKENFSETDLEILKNRKNEIDALKLVSGMNLFVDGKDFIPLTDRNQLRDLVKNLDKGTREKILKTFIEMQDRPQLSFKSNWELRLHTMDKLKNIDDLRSILNLPAPRD